MAAFTPGMEIPARAVVRLALFMCLCTTSPPISDGLNVFRLKKLHQAIRDGVMPIHHVDGHNQAA